MNKSPCMVKAKPNKNENEKIETTIVTGGGINDAKLNCHSHSLIFPQTEEVERIVGLSFVELRDAINSGELKPSQVLLAYQAKVRQIFSGALINYDKETFFKKML